MIPDPPILYCPPGEQDRFAAIAESSGIPGMRVQPADDCAPGECYIRIGPFRAHHTLLLPGQRE